MDFLKLKNYVNSLKNNLVEIKKENWDLIKVKDIFTSISKYGNIAYSYKYEKGEIPFISAKTTNNGLHSYIKIKNENELNKGNCISVSIDGVYSGKCFYQKNDFARTTNLCILRNDKLNKFNALFLITILEKEFMNSYDYNRKLKSAENISDTEISLPIKDGKIDWNYMENYIKNIYKKINH